MKLVFRKIYGGRKQMKKVIAALTATCILTTVGTVMASPMQYDGKLQFQNRMNNNDGADSVENRWKFVLNGKTDAFTDNMKLYFRLSAESIHGSTQTARDFNSFPGQDGTDHNAVGFLDQFGVEIQNAGWNYKIGRQDAFIGANGLIYDSTYGIGRHIFADGITVTGKSGVTNISAVALQVDQYGQNDPKLYAFAAAYNPSKDLTVGTTLAKWNGESISSDKKFWDVNAGYNFNNKLSTYGEYAKSDASADNKAYVYGVNYGIDNRNSLWTCYSHVEKEGNIVDQFSTTTYDNNRKGMWYGFGHKFDKSTSLNLFYSDMKYIDTSKKITSFRTTVNYKF